MVECVFPGPNARHITDYDVGIIEGLPRLLFVRSDPDRLERFDRLYELDGSSHAGPRAARKSELLQAAADCSVGYIARRHFPHCVVWYLERWPHSGSAASQ